MRQFLSVITPKKVGITKVYTISHQDYEPEEAKLMKELASITLQSINQPVYEEMVLRPPPAAEPKQNDYEAMVGINKPAQTPWVTDATAEAMAEVFH